jgi:6,7-dimethyl-8-ribityllumazine synthase
MLTPVSSKSLRSSGGSFAIIASRYNARYVDAMVRAARTELKRAGAKNIRIIRVPGAYEVPIVAARLAREAHGQANTHRASRSKQHVSAIICLGVILRGQTAHAAHIGDAVSRALMDIQLRYEVPVIHEVLLLENEDQARARCLDRKHNRGAEAAQTAVSMAHVMRSLSL